MKKLISLLIAIIIIAGTNAAVAGLSLKKDAKVVQTTTWTQVIRIQKGSVQVTTQPVMQNQMNLVIAPMLKMNFVNAYQMLPDQNMLVQKKLTQSDVVNLRMRDMLMMSYSPQNLNNTTNMTDARKSDASVSVNSKTKCSKVLMKNAQNQATTTSTDVKKKSDVSVSNSNRQSKEVLMNSENTNSTAAIETITGAENMTQSANSNVTVDVKVAMEIMNNTNNG